MTSRKAYEKVVSRYVRQFEVQIGLRLEYWILDEIGGVADFGDWTLNFQDIKYIVDKQIHPDLFFQWWDELIYPEYHKYRGLASTNFESWYNMYRSGTNFNKIQLELNKN